MTGWADGTSGERPSTHVIMKIVGMAVAMTAFGVSFYRWYQASNKSVRSQG